MTNTELLKKTITESGITIVFLADKLDISREAFYMKLNGKTEFKASEIFTLRRLLGLSSKQTEAIFFCAKV